MLVSLTTKYNGFIAKGTVSFRFVPFAERHGYKDIKMRKNVISIFIPIVLVFMIFFCTTFLAKGKPVENNEQAIEIAKAYVLKKYGKEFHDYRIIVKLENDVWIVAYIREGFLGGGGPEVWIKQINGRVIKCFLQL